jgi:endonuclease/exonuclease/phosphatase family metal-dependent hydrolase
VDAGIDHPRNIQYLEIEHEDEGFLIHNLHGFWSKQGNGDTSQRIQQAKNIRNNLSKRNKLQIICGDFNMRPEIKSMEIIESVGLRNLVKEYEVSGTRTSLYDGNEPHADYILVSEDIVVNNFGVLPNEASDHVPLLLDFDIKK